MRRTEAKARLSELIEGRQAGEVLPSERALSVKLGVSRPTLRAALDELAKEGLLVREPGRGTFIAPPARDLASDRSAQPVESHVVDFRAVPAGARFGKRLEVSPGRTLVAVTRVQIVDEAPMAIERILVPQDLVPGITRGDFGSGSVHELLRTRYAVVPATAVQVTWPTVTDPEESGLLGISLHSPALLSERTARDRDGRVVEYIRSIYRGDRYRITTHLTFDHSSG